MNRPFMSPEALRRMFEPVPQQAHHDAMTRIAERMASDWNKVFDQIEGKAK